jgi:phosphatidyl-myo-inositol dimannoside synthase
MRVLLLTEFFPPITGGSQVILSEICSRLPPDDLVVYTAPAPRQEDFDSKQPYRVIRADVFRPVLTRLPELSREEQRLVGGDGFSSRWFPYSRIVRWTSYLRIVADMVRTARREGAETVFCGLPFLAGIAARIHAATSGVPYVVYSYGEELSMLLTRRSMARALQGWALRGAHTVFAISRFSRDVLLGYGVHPDRIRLQYPAVSEIFFAGPTLGREEVRKALGLDPSTPLVLTAARLMERKGIDTTIKALPLILRRFPTVVYLVAGTGADEPRLRRLVHETDVEKNVLFLGDLPHAELVNYYHACDVFSMPNRELEATGETETFGIVFLEANACGRPVIGGNVGGPLDAIEHGKTGFLIDPTNTEELANTLMAVFDNPAMAREMGEYGRRRARERFSWDRNASDVLQACTLAARNARGVSA